MSEIDRFKETYFQECAELLEELEQQLSAAEEAGGDQDTANAVFRAVHSIKGGAGAFGFDDLVEFAHFFETLLDKVREGEIAFTAELAAVGLAACDLLGDLVAAAREGRAVDPQAAQAVRNDLAALSGGAVDADATREDEDFEVDFAPVQVSLDDDGDDDGGDGGGFGAISLDDALGPPRWRIQFTPHAALFARAVDPLLIFEELAGLGVLETECDWSRLPDLDAFAPDQPYLSWTLTLEGPDDAATIEEAFDFAIGDCDLDIARLNADGDASEGDDDGEGVSLMDLLAEVQAEDAASGADAPEPDDGDEAHTDADPSAPPAAAAPSAPPPSAAAEDTGEAAKAAAPAAQKTIRVDLDRVDRVSDMGSEIVITQAGLMQQVDDALRHSHPDLARGLEVLAQQTRMLQDAIMSIRAQPVKTVFSRMPRLVRQLATETGKQVRLQMAGENTEIDKTVIEQLSDPLTHMIRNSVDHGVESPEERLAAGKSEQGTIKLSAEQVSGRILIHIIDDGAGIKRDKVLKRAIERGLVPEDAQLTDDEIDQIIFMPGFSTAEVASNISGRGVGMDVVRQNIEHMGGRVTVRSTPGKGAHITLSLPLTLAVLDVMLVVVSGQRYVLPLSSVIESMTLSDARMGRLPTGETLVNFRGEFVEVLDLRVMLPGAGETGRDQFLVFCEAEGERRVCLMVDAVLGQQQVAIKSLEANFERVEGLGGATVLGDGRVALILDVIGLDRMAKRGGVIQAA